MTPTRWAVAEAALADLSDVDGTSALVCGVRCAALGVDQAWATFARPVTPPTAARCAEIVDWLGAHGSSWSVKVSAADVDADGYRPLRELFTLPVYELTDPDLLGSARPVPGLRIAPTRSPAEFLATYGTDLAPLVTDRHLDSPGYHHLVGWLDGAPVACAMLRRGGGMAYLSAVTVRDDQRRRGIGAAISAAASRWALEAAAGPVWLHAAGQESARIYRRLGYRRVDEHVVLGQA